MRVLLLIWLAILFPLKGKSLPMFQDNTPVPIVRDTIPEPADQDTIPELQLIEPLLDEAQNDTIPEGMQPDPDLTEEPEEELSDTVHVWTYSSPDGFDLAETDSTMRWVSLLNLFDRFHQERGAITYRMGTVGRMDGLELHAYESRHQNLEMEGMKLNDPLTGGVNWNRLAVHKISEFNEADYGAAYRAQTRLRDHYIIQPRTYLNFDESSFNHRSLEFSFTQNFLKTTNLELSFWDRRDGGGFQRQNVEGSQVFGRVYHQLNHNWLLRAGYINNSLDREESFGYNMTDPLFFSFNRFVETPVQSNASSKQSSADFYLQAHHRRDTTRDVSFKTGLHYQTDAWSLTSTADTAATDFRKIELFARQNLEAGPAMFSGTGRLFFLNEREKVNLSETSWAGGSFDLNGSQRFGEIGRIDANANIAAWNDGRLSTELSGRFVLNPLQGTSLSIFGGLLSRAPDIQALYWQSNQYAGNPGLENEESVLIGAEAELTLTDYLIFGLRGDLRDTENAAFIDEEGNFVTIDPYSSTSGTAWLALDSRIFEGELSGTYKNYSSTSLHPVNQLLNTSGDRLWLKGQLYWKNYLFDQATFVKAGVSGVFSPNAFRGAQFITPLNRWQHGTNELINPSYHRLDVDVSARVRWFMILLKWENVLDGVNQLGYFETTGYPMPARRFRFGIRVLFTN
ncbi:MAG: hypothetical protein JJU13_07985 [Balneolaceae bacterium]|nr:hypothetical protein [Balneolaceae bacterium]